MATETPTFKLVLVGDGGTGKVNSFIIFHLHYPLIPLSSTCCALLIGIALRLICPAFALPTLHT